MEITITINGKPVQATVDDAVIREAMGEKKPEKKTGYERNEGGSYYVVAIAGSVHTTNDEMREDDERYKAGNYYSDLIVAQNNARADNLMRNLRRFAAEHGGCVPNRKCRYGHEGNGFIIYMSKISWQLSAAKHEDGQTFGEVIFASYEAAQAAIDAFHDELLWYFTEYDPMPEGWWES